MQRARWSMAALAATAAIAAHVTGAAPAAKRTSAASETLALPAPRTSGRVSLEQALARRRSVRSFTPATLSPAELGQLLWAAQGVTDAERRRTAPSAGALYPLELYVATAGGVHRYEPDGHRLARVAAGDARAALARAALGQDAVAGAPVVFAIAAVPARTARKYGARAQRYVALEAGHAAQNLLLEATALGLGAVPVGAFDDQAVRRALALAPDEEPLYLVPVGHPR